MALSLSSVQRSKSLYEQIYDALRVSILSGELPPGERLIETQLAEKLQVSRTPLREAMRQLQRDALIIADSSGGLKVASISTEDAVHLYDCRIALETLAAREASRNSSTAQLKQLEAIVQQAEHLVGQAVNQQNSSKMLDLDYQFHRLIADSSGNKWLVALLDQLFDKMTLLRTQTTLYNPAVLEIRSEHRRIYDAIASRNGAIAAQAIEDHLVASKERVVQEVQHMRREQPPT